MGYRFLLGWNVFTLLFIFGATLFSFRNYRRIYSHQQGRKAGESGVELQDLEREEAADE